MAKDSEPLGGICRKCCLDLTPDMTIRLWDGKDYCEKCVEDACPGLAEYARTHETLEEEMPNFARRIGVTSAIVGMVGMFGFGILLWLISICYGADPLGEEGLAVILIFSVGGVPLSIVLATISASGFATHRPVVAAKDGQLRVTMRSTTESFSLAECEWYIGKTSQMNHPPFIGRKTGMLRDRAVLIILPRSGARWEYWRQVATGFTEETRPRWEAFLTLAGLPRQRVANTMS